MIEKEKITQLVEEKLSEGQFIVEITVSANNKISVAIDSMEGIKISQCVAISRHIEKSLDRDVEDFELQVSSAGLGQPFKVYLQFVKNESQEIEVVLTDGSKLAGKLTEVNPQGFGLEIVKKEKVDGEKKKQLVHETLRFTYDEVKEAKNIIKF